MAEESRSVSTPPKSTPPKPILGLVILLAWVAMVTWLVLQHFTTSEWLWPKWDDLPTLPSIKKEYYISFLVFFGISAALECFLNQAIKDGISDIFNPERMTHAQVANKFLNYFKFIYTFPRLLLGSPRYDGDWIPFKFKSWPIFLSSTFITVCFTFFLTIIMWNVCYLTDQKLATVFWTGMFVNILSDYMALFVIRKWLEEDAKGSQGTGGRSSRDKAKEESLEGLQALFGILAGVLLVISFTGLRLAVSMVVSLFFDPPSVPDGLHSAFVQINDKTHFVTWDDETVRELGKQIGILHLPGVLAASIVHLWLPGLAIFVYMLRAMEKWLRKGEAAKRAVEKVAGQGHAFPLLMIGIAAGLMFCGLWSLIDEIAPLSILKVIGNDIFNSCRA